MNKLNLNIDKVIVVDPGKNTVEVLCYDADYNLKGTLHFPSITQQRRSFREIDSSSELQFQVEYPDKKYLVGEGILSDYNFETSKNTLHHKVCVDTAIAHFVEKDGENIRLVVGYPSSDYTNKEQKDEYMSLLKNDGAVRLKLDGVDKVFNIVDVEVKPEGVAMKPRVEQVKNRKVKVLDIGGENINYRYYDEKGNTLASQSLDGLGVNHLESFLKTKLRKYVNVKDVDLDTIDYIEGVRAGKLREIRPEDISDFENSEMFIEEAVGEFVDKIVAKLDSKGVSLYRRGDEILFTGGGSLLLRKFFEEVLENNADHLIFSKTSYWDNCISYVIKDVGDRYKALDGDKMENMAMAQLIANKILKEANSLAN